MLKAKFGQDLHLQVGVKHSPRQRFQGFTLAEVLITLGIIGVVAAMTIPTLVQNYNERVWRTGTEVFNRKLEEALKTMNAQSTLAGHTTTESFVEELSKHFKTNKICQNNELLNCFSDVVYWGGGEATPEEVDMSIIKTAKNFGQNDWNTNIVGVQFANGVSALIAYNPTTGDKACTQDPYSNQITGSDCLAILYDTSGAKSPNTSGKDLRANENVTKLGKACAFEINKTCYAITPFPPTPITKAECESLKDNLGIQNCKYNSDYWAGAVKQCGGVSKMPSATQLSEIANYIYRANDKTLDTDKATSLGFILSASDSFYAWTGEENTDEYAYGRYFYSTDSTWNRTLRYSSIPQAVCLAD